jgi:hypothetical protein
MQAQLDEQLAAAADAQVSDTAETLRGAWAPAATIAVPVLVAGQVASLSLTVCLC